MKYVMKDDEIFGYESSQSDLYQQALSAGAKTLTQSEVEDILNPPRTAEQQLNRQRMVRLIAYQTESDPLFIEWQYDKTDEKEQIWRNKVREIKARFPLEVN